MTDPSLAAGTRRGLMLVLSSPSGAGKTTLSRKLLEKDGEIAMSISVTTRPMRPGEKDGVDYSFVTPEAFHQMVKDDALLEHATVFDHQYGTPAKFVEERLRAGKDVLFDIDWQGTRQLASRRPHDLVSIFILPPSLDELERRLQSRAQDSAEVVARRMRKALSEISHWEEYDYVLINQDIGETLAAIHTILCAERTKRTRLTAMAEFVQALA